MDVAEAYENFDAIRSEIKAIFPKDFFGIP